jgi:hypothetical protein
MHIKKRRTIIIFAAIIVSNQIFCMEKEKQEDPYKNLRIVLKNNLVRLNGIEYNAMSPKLQYETLKKSIKKDDMEYLKLCLTYKFNPNRYHKQLSLLHYSVKKHRPAAITILSQYNPDLVPLNEYGETPLDYAVNLQCQDCITAMANAIIEKSNKLLIHQKHCGLTKHILKPGFCEECVTNLKWQLKIYNLSKPLTIPEDIALIKPLFITDNAAIVTEKSSPSK